MEEKRIVHAVKDSLARLSEAKGRVASSVDTKPVARQVNALVKPGSPSSTLKKAGVALIVGTPDPITAVPGVALLAASVATKRKDPTKLDDLAAETRKILRDIESLRL
jgi:hypothetical protein